MRPITLGIALLFAALAPHAAQAKVASLPALDLTPGPGGMIRCAAPALTRAETDAVQARISKSGGFQSNAVLRVTIPIAFHVITCGAQGTVPQSEIDAQVREINKAYRGTGFSFTLATVDRTDNCQWFSQLTSPGTEKKVKQALAVDPAHTLNVYTANLGHNLLGWSYFPQSFPEDSYMHGVVMHYGTLPGEALAPYNLGGTLDHEAGHYLGLYHTFQGGCVAPGDYADDTPFEASPAFGCPVGRNSCPQPGDDPIHNYMDYTDDPCYSEFSANQATRMQSIAQTYRPSLFAAASLVAGGTPVAFAQQPAARTLPTSLEFRGAFPNPFSNSSTLRFALPRSGVVSLKLYNVAGQQVAVLIDGERSAGEQSVTLRAGSLAPGMYFASLRSGGVTVTRSVLLVP